MNRGVVLVAVGLGAVGLAAGLAGCGSGGDAVPVASHGSAAAASGSRATAIVATVPAASPAAVTAATAPAATAPAAAGARAARAGAPAAAAPAATSRPLLPFATPEAAMRYLAAAFNRGDDAALRHVTTPSARQALQEMRAEAVGLRLDRCTRQPAGDYRCTFTHDYPRALRKPATAHGAATFTVGPADRPGWYMTVLESCG